MKRQFALRSAAVLVCTLAVAATASGNGEVFFMPAPTDQPIELAYVGRIKDSETGRPVTGVSMTLTDKRSGLIFPFANDKPGHYRSPDIGASIKDLAGTKIEAADLQLELTVMGYKPVTFTKFPRKTSGIVEVNFKLEPESSNSQGAPLGDSSNDSKGRWIWLAFVGLVAMAVTGAAARTLGRRQSTAR